MEPAALTSAATLTTERSKEPILNAEPAVQRRLLDLQELDARVDEAVLQVNAAWRALGLQVPTHAGDPLARATLISRIYRPLQSHSADLVATLWAYLDNGRSLEATSC